MEAITCDSSNKIEKYVFDNHKYYYTIYVCRRKKFFFHEYGIAIFFPFSHKTSFVLVVFFSSGRKTSEEGGGPGPN
jgi:hypothetical protein